MSGILFRTYAYASEPTDPLCDHLRGYYLEVLAAHSGYYEVKAIATASDSDAEYSDLLERVFTIPARDVNGRIYAWVYESSQTLPELVMEAFKDQRGELVDEDGGRGLKPTGGVANSEGSGWIRCSERLPDAAGFYFTYDSSARIEYWSHETSWGPEVTHWRPLPLPPQESE